MNKIGICIPNEGMTQSEAYGNRLMLTHKLGRLEAEHPDEYEFHYMFIGRVLTPLARERLAEKALEAGMDYIFMIDDDMITEIDMFEKLFQNFEDDKVDICAALAFTRRPDYNPVIYEVEDGYDPLTKNRYFINRSVKIYPKDTLFECDAVGFGAVIFKTDLLRKMSKPWFMSTTGAGEDIWFCHQAKKKAGARIFVDTRVKIGHLGTPPIITEETFEQHNSMDKTREMYGPYQSKKELNKLLGKTR